MPHADLISCLCGSWLLNLLLNTPHTRMQMQHSPQHEVAFQVPYAMRMQGVPCRVCSCKRR